MFFHFSVYVPKLSYFGEVHAVCYKNRNADFSAAVGEGKPDSLAVFGFFLEKSAEDSADANVQTIIDLVTNNPTGSDSVTVKLPTANSLSKYATFFFSFFELKPCKFPSQIFQKNRVLVPLHGRIDNSRMQRNRGMDCFCRHRENFSSPG